MGIGAGEVKLEAELNDGPTPVSRGAEPRAYSPVNVWGCIDDDATLCLAVNQGVRVYLSRAETE